jgi:hypothetical protein
MKLIVRVLTAMTLMCATVPAALADFGAIAYSESTGRYGTSHSYGEQQGAEQRALADCKAADAKIQICVRNGWAALAIDKDGNYAFGWSHDSLEDAERKAESYESGESHILCWVATGSNREEWVYCRNCGRLHMAEYRCPWCNL